jgi:hypothetical protein
MTNKLESTQQTSAERLHQLQDEITQALERGDDTTDLEEMIEGARLDLEMERNGQA